MKSRTFSPLVEGIHKQWVSDTLYLSTDHEWADLVGVDVVFELKCRKLGWKPKGKQVWVVTDEQVQKYEKYYPSTNKYWMFLIYDMNMDVKKIRSWVKKRICYREIWILPWDFIHNYPPTKSSYFNYRYPKQKDFPQKMDNICMDGVEFNYVKDGFIEEFLKKANEVPF